jgi:hypothetical protein
LISKEILAKEMLHNVPLPDEENTWKNHLVDNEDDISTSFHLSPSIRTKGHLFLNEIRKKSRQKSLEET